MATAAHTSDRIRMNHSAVNTMKQCSSDDVVLLLVCSLIGSEV
jgi:hypothetical protein